jgi:hypothetical protein
MMEAVRTSETSVDNHFTRQYNPEDSSELNIRFLQIITVCPIKTLRDIEKLRTYLNSVYIIMPETLKKFTCDKNCVYQCYQPEGYLCCSRSDLFI